MFKTIVFLQSPFCTQNEKKMLINLSKQFKNKCPLITKKIICTNIMAQKGL